MSFIRYIAAFCALLCLSVTAPAMAQDLSPADQDAVAQYRLTEDVLHRMELVAHEMATRHLTPDTSQPMKDLADMAAALERNPEIKQELDKNHLTAQEFVTALIALFMAVEKSQDDASTYADQPLESLPVDEANMRFYQKHQEEIDAFLRQGQG